MPAAVIIVGYDAEWPRLFQRLRQPVVEVLGHLAAATLHVGSTSVPGLAAKPIIDMDVVIRSVADLPIVISRLATLGYVQEGDLGVTGRESFLAPPTSTSARRTVARCGGTSPFATTCAATPRPPGATARINSTWPPASAATAVATPWPSRRLWRRCRGWRGRAASRRRGPILPRRACPYPM